MKKFYKKNKDTIWIGFIIALFFFVLGFAVGDNIKPRPHLVVGKGELVMKDNLNEIIVRIDNVGSLEAEYKTELMINDIPVEPTKNTNIIAPGGFMERTLFSLDPANFEEKYDFNFKIRYWNTEEQKDKNYCIEYDFRYEGDPKHPISVINSGNCE